MTLTTTSMTSLEAVPSIADLQKMAVAEWLQSFSSVRGPMERLGIISVPYTVSPCSSAHWKRTSGSQEI